MAQPRALRRTESANEPARRRPLPCGDRQVRPAVDGGRSPLKRVLGDTVDRRSGRDRRRSRAARLRCCCTRTATRDAWIERADARARRRPLGARSFTVHELGRHRYTVAAWIDAFAYVAAQASCAARSATTSSSRCAKARTLVRDAAARDARRRPRGAARVSPRCSTATNRSTSGAVRALTLERCASSWRQHPDRSLETVLRTTQLEVVVERPLARFSAWYEFFPRSTAGEPARHGTFATAAAPARATSREMGFDVVYLPPIHPIGASHRKGRNNALQATAARPGLTVGDRRGRRRPQERASRSSARSRTSQSFRARSRAARARDRARHRISVLAGSSVRPRASAVVRAAPRRQRAVRRESAEEVRGHLPARFRQRRVARLWQELRDVVEFWIEPRRARVSRRQSAHEAVRLLALADRRRARAATPTRSFSRKRSRGRA